MVKNMKIVILIIVKDEILLQALSLVFQDSSHAVATSSDCVLALTIAREVKPSIIVLDLSLLKADRFNFLKNFKADVLFKDIPIIVLTNSDDKRDVDTAKSLGVIDFFAKSGTNIDELKNRLDEILKIKKGN